MNADYRLEEIKEDLQDIEHNLSDARHELKEVQDTLLNLSDAFNTSNGTGVNLDLIRERFVELAMFLTFLHPEGAGLCLNDDLCVTGCCHTSTLLNDVLGGQGICVNSKNMPFLPCTPS